MSTIECNICGATSFGDFNNRLNVRCLECGSLERTRLLWLYMNKFLNFHVGSKVLHFAPEKSLSYKIRELVGDENYQGVDINPERYKHVPNIRYFDLTCDSEFLNTNSLDFIVHSHVFEHIPCNIAYIIYHFHRALKPTGYHCCIIPFMSGYWDECFNPKLSDEAYIKRFGQFDHVRRFGIENIEMTLGKIINLKSYLNFDASQDFKVEELIRFNIPKKFWKGLTNSTPLLLRKEDYLLQLAN